MERPHEMQRPVLGRDRAMAAQRVPRGPLGRSNAHSVRAHAILLRKYRRRDHRAASALKAIASPPLCMDPYVGLIGAALALLCEKPSPKPTVSRFESPANGFNDIITMF